jgi:hypothetical protein
MHKKILIIPFSRKRRNGSPCAKDYPFLNELLSLIRQDGHQLLQLGATGDMVITDKYVLDADLTKLRESLTWCDTWISIDSFFQHFVASEPENRQKSGVVLWGPSSPEIYGYESNINILLSSSNLIPDQWITWEGVESNPNIWAPPHVIFNELKNRNVI